jgi:hypothetical protein
MVLVEGHDVAVSERRRDVHVLCGLDGGFSTHGILSSVLGRSDGSTHYGSDSAKVYPFQERRYHLAPFVGR